MWSSRTNMKIMSVAWFPLISVFVICRGPKGCMRVLSYCIIATHRTTHVHYDIVCPGNNTQSSLGDNWINAMLWSSEGGYCSGLLISGMVITQIVTTCRCWELSSRKLLASCDHWVVISFLVLSSWVQYALSNEYHGCLAGANWRAGPPYISRKRDF